MGDPRLEALQQAVLDGDEELAADAAAQALEAALDPQAILDVLSGAADELGRRYEAGDCYLPELFAGAEAMSAAVDRLLPALESSGARPAGTVLIGTVEGDIHDIGKRIVAAMLSGAGFRVHDLGTDVRADVFAAKAQELHPDIVAASAYITTTSQMLPQISKALVEAGIRSRVMYLIGGAAVSPEMVALAGADAYGSNAAEAVTVARGLVAKSLLGPDP
jgi:5-methyltetrahydrofolate--homocysteine methyltransferase